MPLKPLAWAMGVKVGWVTDSLNIYFKQIKWVRYCCRCWRYNDQNKQKLISPRSLCSNGERGDNWRRRWDGRRIYLKGSVKLENTDSQLEKWDRQLDYGSSIYRSGDADMEVEANKMVFQTSFPESDHVSLQTLYRGSAEEKQAADRGGCYATDEESHPTRQNWCWPLGTKCRSPS